jgi:hypothetical protein
MRRRIFIAGLIAVTLGGSIDLGACGDKFLRVGRSARFRRYGAVHRASILIVSPAGATRAGINDLTSILARAGHKPVALDRQANVSAALAASRYDLVIADYLDAGRLRADLQSAGSQAALLPMLDKPTKAVEAEAMQQYAFLIKLHEMTKYDALAEIDRLMESAGRGTRVEK